MTKLVEDLCVLEIKLTIYVTADNQLNAKPVLKQKHLAMNFRFRKEDPQ